MSKSPDPATHHPSEPSLQVVTYGWLERSSELAQVPMSVSELSGARMITACVSPAVSLCPYDKNYHPKLTLLNLSS